MARLHRMRRAVADGKSRLPGNRSNQRVGSNQQSGKERIARTAGLSPPYKTKRGKHHEELGCRFGAAIGDLHDRRLSAPIPTLG